jgi:hypothetical protein
MRKSETIALYALLGALSAGTQRSVSIQIILFIKDLIADFLPKV